jgi:multicomponent Na+:H+ antiporter subunit E
MLASWLVLFGITLGFWGLLSGHGDLLHLGGGVVSAAVVATLTVRVERGHLRSGAPAREAVPPLFRLSRTWARFALYLPWLFLQMIRSALQVAWVLVHPRLPIAPRVVAVPVRLAGDLPLTTYANSITLTPGTVTVDLEPGRLLVHALTRAGATDLLEGSMERRIAWTFGQPHR